MTINNDSDTLIAAHDRAAAHYAECFAALEAAQKKAAAVVYDFDEDAASTSAALWFADEQLQEAAIEWAEAAKAAGLDAPYLGDAWDA